MTGKIDGECFRNMVDYAVRNLDKHRSVVNQLNVFPVPDGDTGTNMVTTIHKGFLAMGDNFDDLPSVSRKFAHAIVFEARGNSGVIVSQFLKGMSEKFCEADTVDGARLIEALEEGVACAYSSVAVPVEGTMLTVIKDATGAVKGEYDGNQGVDQIIGSFVEHAKKSLERTPELLPVLKEKGVVDSGGAGIVYLFEGMKKYFDGEDLAPTENESEKELVNYDAFDRYSHFEYGYCTELLIQLLADRKEFVYEEFRTKLFELGDSLVISCQNDKVRVHIHTHFPEKIFAFCHAYGEFLSLKIENMTVQHTDIEERIMCSKEKNNGAFAVVAVAYDRVMQNMFLEMGADVVIYCENGVSTKDYLDAFEKADAENILVFPNSSDAVLSAVQAKKLYKDSKVTVINSRGIAECYASLPTIDFEETDIDQAIDDITKVINNLYIVSVAQRKTPILYGDKNIFGNEYYSFSGRELLVINKSFIDTVVETIDKTIQKYDREIITIFHKRSVPSDEIEAVVESIESLGICAEVFTVPTDSLSCLLTISFE